MVAISNRNLSSLEFIHTHTEMKTQLKLPFSAELRSAEPHNQSVRSSVFMWERGSEREEGRGRKTGLQYPVSDIPSVTSLF